MQAILKWTIIWQKTGFICILLFFGLTACERQPPPLSTPVVQDTHKSSTASAYYTPKPAAPPEATPRVESPPPAAPSPEPSTQIAEPVAKAAPAKTPAIRMPAEKPAAPPAAAWPDAKSVVKKSDDLMRGDTAQGTYIMEITTPSWSRTLELAVYSKGRDRVFIRIQSPAKEAGTGTLRIDNEMWNYLPRIEKVIKIPPSMMLQSWMGSDFANDDLVKENSIVEDYTHRIVAEETLGGQPAYKIELIPKPGAAVIWGKLYYWIRPADYVPLRQDFYDERGRLVKRLDYSDIEKVSDRTVPRTWLMTNLLKDGKSTRIYLKDVVYNQPIDDNIYTLSNLKRLQ